MRFEFSGEKSIKRMFFGSMLILVGIALCIPCVFCAAAKPWDYYGIEGLLGSLLGTRLIFPVVIGLALQLAGLIICCVNAYKK